MSVPPPIPLYPPAPKTTFAKSEKLRRALVNAVNARSNPPTPIPITIIDLGPALARSGASSLPIASNLETQMDYIASEGKVGIMYAAYVLRDMVKRFVVARAPKTEAELFAQLRKTMNPAIEASVPRVLNGAPSRTHRLPTYEMMFTAPKPGNTLMVRFRDDFIRTLDYMIIPSDNGHAGRGVHALGWSYLNGALAAGGFFNDATGQGLWVGGDYQFGKVWPPVRIKTVNDTASGVGSTSEAMARLMAVIVTGGVLDETSCDEMRTRLHNAAQPDRKRWPNGDQSWLTRDAEPDGLPLTSVTHDKIGLGPLNAGGDVWSEACVVTGVGGSGRNYAVAFQDSRPGRLSTTDVVHVLRSTIAAYERAGP